MWIRSCDDARAELVAHRNGRHALRAVVEVVTHVVQHARCVAVVVIVEGMSSVPGAWRHGRQVPQPGSPEDAAADDRPLAIEIHGQERASTLASS
eukprot:scaffold14362_cov142-Isochrysis_galbana.AAC.8